MVKKLDVAGLTNALTDISVRVSEEELDSFGLVKGEYSGIGRIDEKKFFELLSPREKRFFHAGSPANVIFNLAFLGFNTALMGSLGTDEIAENYLGELKHYKIKPLFGRVEGASGVCYILVSEDGEKTCVANMGVAGAYNFDLKKLKSARVFHTSGYELVSNPSRVLESVDYARKIGAKISFDLADAQIVKKETQNIEKIIGKTDILFMTEEEAVELTGKGPLTSLEQMSKICPIVALKKGANGSVVRKGYEEYEIAIFPVNVISTCGAGDAYASGFLSGYIRGKGLKFCGEAGSLVASRVCASESSHL